MKKHLLYLFSCLLLFLVNIQAQSPKDNLLGYYVGVTKQTNTITSTGSSSSSIEKILSLSSYPKVIIWDSSSFSPSWATSSGVSAFDDSTIRNSINPIYIMGRLYSNDSLYYYWHYSCCPYIKMEFFGFKQYGYPAPVGISEIEDKNVIIYPNPTGNKLQIRSDEGLRLNPFHFYDVWGKEIFLKVTGKEEYDVSELAEGLYFLEIETEQGILRKKIIVKR